MKKEYIGTQGTYTLRCADMECIEALIQLIATKAKDLNLTALATSFSGLDELLQQDLSIIIPLLQQVICSLESDKEFTELTYALMQSCTINNVPVSRQLFNDKPELREDYYGLKLEVVKFNLAPFLKTLSGKLSQPVNSDQ